MARREVTRRRLRLVLAGLVLLALMAVGGYFARQWQQERSAVAGRDEGMKLLAAGEYAGAMHKLGPYIRRHPDDAVTLLAYAKARLNTPLAEGQHIVQAMGLYRQALTLDPTNAQATGELLALYESAGFSTEAMNLADQILATDKTNRLALHTRAVSLVRLKRSDEALEAARALAIAHPDDPRGHMIVLETLASTRQAAEAASYLQELETARPDDPFMGLYRSVVQVWNNDILGARESLRPALAVSPLEPDVVRLLINQCDRIAMYPEAIALLEREASTDDPVIRELLVTRLWESGRYAQMVDRLADTGIRVTPVSRGLLVLTLDDLGRTAEADAALAALKADTTDSRSIEYAQVIAAVRAKPRNETAIREAAQRAIGTSPADPYLNFFLAEAYAKLGDVDGAIRHWTIAADNAPAWSTPVARLASARFQSGNPAEAINALRLALIRSSTDRDALTTRAVIAAVASSKERVESVLGLQAVLDETDKVAPDLEALIPLKIQAKLLADDVPAATALLDAAIKRQPAVSEATLIQIATVVTDPSLSETAIIAAEKAYGITPATASYRARVAMGSGQDAQTVLQEFDAAMAASTDPASRDWRLVRASLLSASRDPRAVAEWTALVESYPQDAAVQWQALGGPAATDRAFAGKVLENLRALIGDDGLSWQFAYARWLAAGGTPKDLTDAAIRLGNVTRGAPDLVQPRILLSEVFLSQGNRNDAIGQLAAATSLDPNNADAGLRLARLYADAGETDKARIEADRILGLSRPLTAAQKRLAAQVLATSGDTARALALLQQAGVDSAGDAESGLLLASLYQSSGRNDDAEKVLTELLKKPDVRTIAFAAEFYASQNRSEQAEEVLSRIAQANPEPGVSQIVIGEHRMRHGKTDEGISMLGEATRVAPESELAWQQYIVALLMTSRTDDAAAALTAASRTLPRSERFAAASRILSVAQPRIKDYPAAIGLVGAVLTNPAVESPSAELLRILDSMTARADNATMRRVREIADSNPSVPSIQLIASAIALQSGQPELAAALAARGQRSAAADATLARLAALSAASAGQWDNAVSAGEQWRQLAGPDTVEPDLFIANALLRAGRAAQAVELLDQAVARPDLSPADRERSTLLQAQANIAVGKSDAALEKISPMLAGSATARDAAAELAGSAVTARTVEPWLDAVTAAAPDDANLAAKVAFAWHRAAVRTNDPKVTARAASAIDAAIAMASKVDNAESLIGLGIACESTGRFADAQANYRAALERSPGNPIASNNLAMLLLTQGGSVDEAEKLASTAAAVSHPARANFLDTLAQVQLRKGDTATAVATLKEAIQLQPNVVAWRLHLAEAQLAAGNRVEARTSFDEATAIATTVGGLTGEDRNELDRVRKLFDPGGE